MYISVHRPLAQLIVHAPTRPEALSGLRKALREFEVVGLPTNLDFCERVAGHRAFEKGGVTTAFLEEHGDEVMPPPEVRPPPPHAVVLASVAVLLEEVCVSSLVAVVDAVGGSRCVQNRPQAKEVEPQQRPDVFVQTVPCTYPPSTDGSTQPTPPCAAAVVFTRSRIIFSLERSNPSPSPAPASAALCPERFFFLASGRDLS